MHATCVGTLNATHPSQCAIQALEPFFSVVLSALFLGDAPTLPVILTLFPIVGGVAMASVTEVTFNWPGFLAAMGSNITFQSRNVLSKKFMGKGAKVHMRKDLTLPSSGGLFCLRMCCCNNVSKERDSRHAAEVHASAAGCVLQEACCQHQQLAG